MGACNDGEALAKLRRAYDSGNLMLYIGAGVSVPSGLPTFITFKTSQT